MGKESNYQGLKKFCLGLGPELFGVADIKSAKKEFALSQKLLKEFDYAVSLGSRLSASVLEDIEGSPTRLYFHHYKTANMFLDQCAFKTAQYMQKKGYEAIPIPASLILDWQKQTAHLSHKKIGLLSGLGWVGRNNLLVNKRLGSQFRLTTILTNMPLRTDKPAQDNCGACRLCVEACPSASIKEKPEDFDYHSCLEKLKEFQKQRLADQFICGVCVKACKGGARTS